MIYFIVIIELEKVYDRVPREIMRLVLEKKRIPLQAKL